MSLSLHNGHPCGNPHCERPAQNGHLACAGCWFSLPKASRDGIFASWRAGKMSEHRRFVAEAREIWAVQHFKQLIRFRDDGASMSTAQFQTHLRDTPGFKAWCEREGVL